MSAESDAKHIEKCREVFGKTCLSYLNDEQTLEFYRTLKRFYAQGIAKPFEKLTRIVLSWNAIPNANARSVKGRIGKVAAQLFRPLAEQRKILGKKTVIRAAQITENGIARREKDAEKRFKAKYDPLARAIGLADKLERKLDTMLDGSYSDATDVSKIANSLLATFTQINELLSKLKFFGDEDTLAKYRDHIQIDHLQVVMQRGVENREGIGTLLNRFQQLLPEIATNHDVETKPNAAGLHEPVREPDSSVESLVDIRDGGGDEPFRSPACREVSPESSPGDDGTDPA